jgi:lipid-binding SYLF domain-containing protein
MRTGLWVSGAGGSGVLVARKADGSWSPPSGLLVHTLRVGFMAGIDIYDCVVVINDRKALEAFSKQRVSLGGELSVVAGPIGIGGIVESEVLKDRKPVWSYVKSRGLYGGLQIDGTIIIERNDENARFYGERLPVGQILAGNVRHVPAETRMLVEVLKQAEGRTDLNQEILAQADHQPPPGDVAVEKINEPTQQQVNAYKPPADYYATSGLYPPGKTGHGQQGGGAPYFPPPPGSEGQVQQTQYYAPSHDQQQQQSQHYAPPPTNQGHNEYYAPPPARPPPTGQGQSEAYYPPPPPGPPPTRDEKHL